MIRHGQTEWNLQRRIQGWLDSRLTDSAVLRLNKMILPTLQSPLLFSSDLGRASATANIIAKRIHVPVKLDKRLRERGFGILEGKIVDSDPALEQYWKEYHQRYQRKMSQLIGVESEQVLEWRVKEFLAELQNRDIGSDVVIVGHGECLRTLSNLVQDIPSWHYGNGIGNNAESVTLEWLPDVLVDPFNVIKGHCS